ncbi:MAG: hypothetical protein ACRBN8_13720 [Nannocystales bacterium]
MNPFKRSRSISKSLSVAVAGAVLLAAGSAAAASYCYTFSGPNVGTSHTVGDTLTPNGSTVEFLQFQWSSGIWTPAGVATVVMSNHATGVANELNLNNINLRVIPDTPALTASYKYADFGGNVNMGVNGDFRNTSDMMDLDGTVVGGCDVEVTETVAVGHMFGEVDIICPDPVVIDRFGMGGQEFFVDDICFED